MSLRFILGRAGAGKTFTCLQEIRDELLKAPDGSPLILLVPEQATFQMEKELIESAGLHGTIRAQVLSFRRLAYRVLLEVGGATRPHIGDLGKRMLLRNIVEKRKDNLKVFARTAKQPGFADSLANTLSELKMYGIDYSTLEGALATLNASQETTRSQQLIDKLSDLSILYKDLEAYLAGRFTDPDDYLSLLAQQILRAESLKDAKIWVDGFSGFTPQEYKVLENLLMKVKQVNVALCLDTQEINLKAKQEDLFYITKVTYERFNKLAKQALIPISNNLYLDNASAKRFQEAPAVSHLEENFFKRPTPIFAQPVSDIRITAAANPRVEIEAVAREIIGLTRDEGYRWRDISVIIRDLTAYNSYIQAIFTDFGIPFFVDQKQPVIHHPLIECVRSVLEIIESNWAYEPVFRYFKTDFSPLSRDEVDLLENYVLAHGIRGKRWIDGKAWAYSRRITLGEDFELNEREKDYLNNINHIKVLGTTAISEFYTTIVSNVDAKVKDYCEALFVLLEKLDVAGKLQQFNKDAAEAGEVQKAKEHAQVWTDFIGLLDEINEALGEAQLSLNEFLQLINTGFESMRLGLIPPALDQVLVASLERSRNPNIKSAFVLGVNDGMLPKRQNDSGLINDNERQYLSRVGLELAPDSRRKLLDEQFLIYIALTRASKRLYLSYALANAEGSALTPSMVITRVKELLPQVNEKLIAIEPGTHEAEEYLTNKNKALTFIAGQFRNYKNFILQGQKVDIQPLCKDVYNYALEVPELKDKVGGHIAGLFHKNNEANIPKDLTQRLYGKRIKGSVSRLERFAACPFQHFLSHGLKLRERRYYKLAAPDLGQFFHAAIKRVSDMVTQEGLDWANLDRKKCQELTKETVSELAPQLQNEILLSTNRLRYLTNKLERIVERSVRTLVEHAKKGKFRPVGLEIGFGEMGDLPPLEIKLQDGTALEMSGRIDRIDSVKNGDQSYLRIIDFKSGTSKLKLLDICMGTKLQLMTYLDVALENARELIGEEAKPAGILYFPLIDPVINCDSLLPEEEIEEAILKKMKTNGLILSDTDIVNLMDGKISKYSLLIPVGLNKDGGLYANSSVVNETEFSTLRAYVRETLSKFARQIAEGEVKIDPYQKQSFKVCQYCSFKAVCQFDPLLLDNNFRVFPKLEINEVWEQIKATLGGGEEYGSKLDK